MSQLSLVGATRSLLSGGAGAGAKSHVLEPVTQQAKRLVVRNVSYSYALTDILSGINLVLEAGRVSALVGPSGCGKTTLMHLVAGLLSVRQGQIESGFDTMACVFQQPRLLPWKTAQDNIALGLKAAGVAQAQRMFRTSEFAARVGLGADDLHKYPHQLSGGMQSRVALARALVLEPDLLLLDEPFSALDIGLKAELYELLAEHITQRQMAVLMITHDVMEAVRLSDTILVMAAVPGRVVQRVMLDHPVQQRDESFVYQNTALLLENPEVRRVFGLPEKKRAGVSSTASACLQFKAEAASQPINSSRGVRC